MEATWQYGTYANPHINTTNKLKMCVGRTACRNNSLLAIDHNFQSFLCFYVVISGYGLVTSGYDDRRTRPVQSQVPMFFRDVNGICLYLLWESRTTSSLLLPVFICGFGLVVMTIASHAIGPRFNAGSRPGPYFCCRCA